MLPENVRYRYKKPQKAEQKSPPSPDPDYPYGKIPRKGTAPRVMPPIHQMPPKPPGANPKK